MANPPTANYGFTLPLVGGDADAWGAELNTNWTNLDGYLSTASSAANAAQTTANAALPKAGGTLTGPIVLAADPAAALQPATKQYVDGGRLGDNRIINGDMRVNQRGVTNSAVYNGVYTCDRWAVFGTVAGKGNWQVSTTSPTSFAGMAGFQYSLSWNTTTAYTPGASDNFEFYQAIEADMIADFASGTAQAQPLTLSFWAQSSLTGTFGGTLNAASSGGAGTNRCYPFSYSLSTANTWTKITIAIPGDTTGTNWVLSGNGVGLWLQFDLGSGPSYRAPAGAWTAGNIVGANGTVSVISTNGAYWSMTGVKLEIGNVATPFNRQSLAKSLADCQRYYEQEYAFVAGYQAAAAKNIDQTISFNVMKRASPTLTMAFAGTTNVNTSSSSAWVNPGQKGGFVIELVTIAAGAIASGVNWTASAEF